MEITATIDGRIKTITEASIRRHLKLEDSDGINTLPNTKIFEQLALIGFIIYKVKDQQSQLSPITHPLVLHPPYNHQLHQHLSKITYVAEETATMPHDSPLPRLHRGSDEGNLTRNELMVLCTTLSKKVEDLESDLKQTKLTYGSTYTKLIMRVKKLEHKAKLRKSIRRARLVVSEDEADLEDPSKQGTEETEEINLSASTEVFEEENTKKDVSTDGDAFTTSNTILEVSAAGPSTVSIAGSSSSTAGEEPRRTDPEPTSQSQPSYKDKGKEKMIEPDEPVKIKIKVQKRAAQEEASKEAIDEELDDIKAMIETDEQMATRLQLEEQEKYTIEEKARMLNEMITKRKKFFVAQRAAKIRSRPLTKAQVRNRMCTNLKNQAGYTHKQLKGKSYDEIQKLFDKAYKQVSSFVPIDIEVIKDSGKKDDSSSKLAGGSRKKTLTRKRAGEKQSEESTKRKKLEDVAEKEELKTYLKIDHDEDRAVNYEALATKYLIVDWESQIIESDLQENDLSYWKITRVDDSSKFYKVFSMMLKDFDRQDLVYLHRLIMERFSSRTLEGYDLILWGDFKTMFEPIEEDDVWRNQQDWSLISWKLYESCGVHAFLMDGILVCINMLVEKKYPLTQEVLTRILN
ncbi:hypothetical protein Tco_0547463 [Tanacetum coccineum]